MRSAAVLVFIAQVAALRPLIGGMTTLMQPRAAIHMKDDVDLNAAFANRLKATTGTAAPKQAKRRAAAQDAAEAKKNAPKNRLGARLDLGNKPQNFFRGLADRDEASTVSADEDADLMSESDKTIFLIGFGLLAALLLGTKGISAFDQQQYDNAMVDKNFDLVRCLDYAFSGSEKLICRLKYN